MKRIVLIALLALAFPLAAFANSTWDYTTIDGILTGSNSLLTLGAGDVINVDGPHASCLFCTLNFTAGAFSGGALNPLNNLLNAGTFSATNSTFTVLEKGNTNPIFSGTFTNPVAWTPEGNGIYQISGDVRGTLTLTTGVKEEVNGFTSQLYFGTVTGAIGHQTFSFTLGSGDTILTTTTPEPGTLGLLGTGLLGLAGALHRKLKT